MTPPAASVETARAALVRLAEGIGDPWAARLIAEAADHVGPKVSGPSRARQRATTRRDETLRRLYREEFWDLTARAAAQLITSRAARYARRLDNDLALRRRPGGSVEQAAFDAAVEGLKMPGTERLREILGG